MNAISSLTLRGPVFARRHSWIRAVMHPDTMASKFTSYAMKYGYDETNADNTLAYTGNHDAYIYRHLNDCMSDTVMIPMQSWDSLCVCIIMMYDTLFMLSYEYIACIHGIIHADSNCLIQGHGIIHD